MPLSMLSDVAFVEDHVSVELCPLLIAAGFAASVTVGAATGAFTVTMAAAVAVPPAPMTVMLYVVVCCGVTIIVPDGCTAPIPLSICAEVALVEDHVSVALCPAFTVVGLAENVTVGCGAGPLASPRVQLESAPASRSKKRNETMRYIMMN